MIKLFKMTLRRKAISEAGEFKACKQCKRATKEAKVWDFEGVQFN